MHILTNKSKKTYSYISRYASVPFYYHSIDKKYIYGITRHLSTTTPYVEVNVGQEDTLDILANKYYGRPDYFSIIADFNRIQDPFIKLNEHYVKIKIPSLTSIEYEE